MESINISPIEQYVIDKVREMRIAKVYLKENLQTYWIFQMGLSVWQKAQKREPSIICNTLTTLQRSLNVHLKTFCQITRFNVG